MGHRTKAELAGITKARPASASVVKWPNVDPEWHDLAKDWYRSLRISGQAQFYEPTDVQLARVVAELLSRELNKGQRVSSQMIASIFSAMTDLLTTEGARRRARIELERGAAPADDPKVAIMAKYREAAEGK